MLESQGKRDKCEDAIRRYISIVDNIVTRRIIVEESTIIKLISYVIFLTFKKILASFLEQRCGRD